MGMGVWIGALSLVILLFPTPEVEGLKCWTVNPGCKIKPCYNPGNRQFILSTCSSDEKSCKVTFDAFEDILIQDEDVHIVSKECSTEERPGCRPQPANKNMTECFCTEDACDAWMSFEEADEDIKSNRTKKTTTTHRSSSSNTTTTTLPLLSSLIITLLLISIPFKHSF